MSSLKDKIKKSTTMGGTKELFIINKLERLFDVEFDREDRIGLHASNILASEKDFCYRELVLSFYYKKNKTELPSNLKRIFLEGTYIHRKWQNLFVKAGIATAIEKQHHIEEFDCYMTPDAEIRIGKTEYIVEIKSMNTFAFKHATTHPKGAKQCKFYMHYKGKTHGIVLMEDKNNQDIKIQLIEYNPDDGDEDIKGYVKRLENIKKYRKIFEKESKVPKRICKSSDCKRAIGCPMRDACFNIGMKRIWKEKDKC